MAAQVSLPALVLLALGTLTAIELQILTCCLRRDHSTETLQRDHSTESAE
jgi:hypothetical protein